MDDRRLNILLVEDDQLDVMNVQRAFKKNNVVNPLYIAGNGLEALEMLRGRRQPAVPRERRLILLDLNMPKMGDRVPQGAPRRPGAARHHRRRAHDLRRGARQGEGV